ncbi:PRC-barrel domain-containing protein [Pseudooceanicola sp.]|uniref:PRC-barrel domain-containing protein n=1 Tax=Pseudooceanicola sp. TaxID=1914328 RepID=UPI0040585F29
MHSKRSTVLLGTAMSLAVAGGATAATDINLNRNVIPNLNESCQALAEEIRAWNNSVPDEHSDMIIEALNSDDPQACAQAEETLASAEPTEEMRDSETLQASDRETAEMEMSDEVTERVELEQQATIEGQAAVIVPEPQVDVEVDAPEVTVRKSQPQVSVQERAATIQVEQPQPNVAVQIPEIIVQVEVPAPRIFVQTDEPTVDVASADPQVEVQQGEPRVTVRQPDPELRVDLGVESQGEEALPGEPQMAEDMDDDTEMNRGGDVDVASNAPQVRIVEPEGEPEVSIASAQPNVEFRGSDPNVSVSFAQEPTVQISQTGQPTVTFETSEEREARMQQTEDSRQASAAQAESDAQQQTDMQADIILVGDLLDMDVIGANGEDLGEPEAVIERAGRMMIVIEEGGFLGLGQNAVAIPMERVAFNIEEEELQLQQLTEDEIEDASDFEYDASEELGMNDQVRLR